MFGGTGEDEDAVAAEGTRDRRRYAEYTKDGPTGQERSPTKSSSCTHCDSLSFVLSFLVFLFFLRSYSFFLFYSCPYDCLLRRSTARNVLYSIHELRNYTARTWYMLDRLLRDLDHVRLFLRLRANFEAPTEKP